MKKQYEAWYTLLDGSPRNLYPIYAVDKDDALAQAAEYARASVSKDYDIRNIKIKKV